MARCWSQIVLTKLLSYVVALLSIEAEDADRSGGGVQL